jgi:hypothetical protein
LLDIYKLRHTYLGLKARRRALVAAEPTASPAEAEGYEIQGSASEEKLSAAPSTGSSQNERRRLKRDFVQWKDAVMINSCVYIIDCRRV